MTTFGVVHVLITMPHGVIHVMSTLVVAPTMYQIEASLTVRIASKTATTARTVTNGTQKVAIHVTEIV